MGHCILICMLYFYKRIIQTEGALFQFQMYCVFFGQCVLPRYKAHLIQQAISATYALILYKKLLKIVENIDQPLLITTHLVFLRLHFRNSPWLEEKPSNYSWKNRLSCPEKKGVRLLFFQDRIIHSSYMIWGFPSNLHERINQNLF